MAGKFAELPRPELVQSGQESWRLLSGCRWADAGRHEWKRSELLGAQLLAVHMSVTQGGCVGGLQKTILSAQVSWGWWAGALRETGVVAARSETATGSGHWAWSGLSGCWGTTYTLWVHSGGRMIVGVYAHTRTIARSHSRSKPKQKGSFQKEEEVPVSCNVPRLTSVDKAEHVHYKGEMLRGAGVREGLWSRGAMKWERTQSAPAATQPPCVLSLAHLNSC